MKFLSTTFCLLVLVCPPFFALGFYQKAKKYEVIAAYKDAPVTGTPKKREASVSQNRRELGETNSDSITYGFLLQKIEVPEVLWNSINPKREQVFADIFTNHGNHGEVFSTSSIAEATIKSKAKHGNKFFIFVEIDFEKVKAISLISSESEKEKKTFRPFTVVLRNPNDEINWKELMHFDIEKLKNDQAIDEYLRGLKKYRSFLRGRR